MRNCLYLSSDLPPLSGSLPFPEGRRPGLKNLLRDLDAQQGPVEPLATRARQPGCSHTCSPTETAISRIDGPTRTKNAVTFPRPGTAVSGPASSVLAPAEKICTFSAATVASVSAVMTGIRLSLLDCSEVSLTKALKD